MAALAEVQPGLVLAIEALLLTAFGLKAAVFPAMFWLPASYQRAFEPARQ
jgi:multicomponent Na+:H+ antiporter subunit D